MRLNNLKTPHGILRLPAFFPDATRGAVRSIDSADLENCGVQGIVVNTFHLLSKPGARIINIHDGIHNFMNWKSHIISDSGGFQLFSFLRESSKLGSISKRGFIYHLSKEKKEILTPEKCIQKQFQFGSDIMVCLDYCTHPDDNYEKQKLSVEYTILWAEKSKEIFYRFLQEKHVDDEKKPLLFGVVQGGNDFNLRRECAEKLIDMDFDGYGYGGWPIVEGNQLAESLEFLSQILPPSKPKYALGVGKPENIVKCVQMGYEIFDCVIPTRDARHRRLYKFLDNPKNLKLNSDFYECLYMTDKKHIDDKRPLDEECDCLCCKRYSRSYLYHLFQIEDTLAYRLATIHNLRFYSRLMESIQNYNF